MPRRFLLRWSPSGIDNSRSTGTVQQLLLPRGGLARLSPKLLCCVNMNGTVISVLKVHDGSLETTHVEKSSIETVLNVNVTWRTDTDKKEWHIGTYRVKRVGAIMHLCFIPLRMVKGSFSPVDEDSCRRLFVEKSQGGFEVGRDPNLDDTFQRASRLLESLALVNGKHV